MLKYLIKAYQIPILLYIYITLTITCIPTPRDEPVELSNTVIQHPNYKSKWKPECTDIYNNSFVSNELTTINDEINLF